MTAQKAHQLILEKQKELDKAQITPYNPKDTTSVYYHMKRIFELENDINELLYIHRHS